MWSCCRPWQGWSLEAFNYWGPYLRVVLANIAMVVLDWWTTDIATLLAGAQRATLRSIGACRLQAAAYFSLALGDSTQQRCVGVHYWCSFEVVCSQ